VSKEKGKSSLPILPIGLAIAAIVGIILGIVIPTIPNNSALRDLLSILGEGSTKVYGAYYSGLLALIAITLIFLSNMKIIELLAVVLLFVAIDLAAVALILGIISISFGLSIPA
jgi:hypothetical protein